MLSTHPQPLPDFTDSPPLLIKDDSHILNLSQHSNATKISPTGQQSEGSRPRKPSAKKSSRASSSNRRTRDKKKPSPMIMQTTPTEQVVGNALDVWS